MRVKLKEQHEILTLARNLVWHLLLCRVIESKGTRSHCKPVDYSRDDAAHLSLTHKNAHALLNTYTNANTLTT